MNKEIKIRLILSEKNKPKFDTGTAIIEVSQGDFRKCSQEFTGKIWNEIYDYLGINKRFKRKLEFLS